MAEYQSEKKLIELLLIRLERISVDSSLAHRAGGIRGALLREFTSMNSGKVINTSSLEQLINSGFKLVETAASEQISDQLI